MKLSRNLHTPTQAELAACEKALDTCTCAKLEDDDQVACGLTKKKPAP